jgi:transaldolase
VGTPLHALAEHGQSPWVDYLSRPFVRNGELERLVDAGITGVTSNPTIFAGAIADGDAYDEQMRDVLRAGTTDAKEVFLALAVEDVRAACDVLRPTFESSRTGRDGWVSLEVDPRLANDTEATSAEARRLHGLVDRPNLMVKIPGTEAGLPAIEETIARGIPVNVTLLFSLGRHRAAAEAYIRGLERLRHSGGDLTSVASVASFFVSRVDTEADRRLAETGRHDSLRGTLGAANAKLAYQTYVNVFSGPRWTDLADAGARPQWCLWASTSMKDPQRPDVWYVEQLVGPDTVDTMPIQTVAAFQDHGRVTDLLVHDVDAASATLAAFGAAGIDYDDVVAALERDGVQKFGASFQSLFDRIAAKRDQLLNA